MASGDISNSNCWCQQFELIKFESYTEWQVATGMIFDSNSSVIQSPV